MSAYTYQWHKLSDKDLLDVAYGSKSDLERSDMYGLIEELALRLQKKSNALSRF